MENNKTKNVSFLDNIPTWFVIIMPLVLLGGLIALFLSRNPIRISSTKLPPIENLTIQRIDVTPDGFEVHVTNGGPDTIDIAQVMVDEAYFHYTIEPGNRLSRLESAVLNIDYPWVITEPNEIVIVTSTGATFAGEVAIAVETPTPDTSLVLNYALVGLFVGIIPVGLGLLWFPAMRKTSRRGMDFLLSLTIGLLFFLLVDTILEAFELADRLPDVFQGVPLSLFIAVLTWLGISAIGSHKAFADRSTAKGRLFVALLIAVGIGFHNLGEGLVVGAAFAIGEAALGSFLVVGFILHNITEGIGIVAPITRDAPKNRWFFILLLIAGGPAIVGTLVGGFAFSPLLAVIFLGVGTGAIWQVIYEVGQLMLREAAKAKASMINWINVSGLFLGITIMYLTAFLVKF